jgi:hypothetical protein
MQEKLHVVDLNGMSLKQREMFHSEVQASLGRNEPFDPAHWTKLAARYKARYKADRREAQLRRRRVCKEVGRSIVGGLIGCAIGQVFIYAVQYMR